MSAFQLPYAYALIRQCRTNVKQKRPGPLLIRAFKVGRSREERGEVAGELEGEGVFYPATKLLVGNVSVSGLVPHKLNNYRRAHRVRKGRALRVQLLH